MDKHERIGGFEEAWRSQVLAGLSVSPAERLRWLEQAIEFAARAGAKSYSQIFELREKP
jgi:hypothetical protein